MAAAAALLLLAACASDTRLGEIGAVEGFIGGVATDEPNAAVVARDVLSAGGSAADAAVAAFFTLTVTYPVGAGIGGGGICLAYDAGTNEAAAFEFLAGQPAAGGPYAVPGAVRGLSALHARHGRLDWSALVAPAEKLARFGHSMSRALAARLAEAERAGELAPPIRALFEREDGSLKGEGEPLRRVALAATLGAIRAQGAGALYGGPLGRAFARSARATGAGIELTDLRAYRPTIRPTRALEFGDELLHVAPPPPAGGGVLLALLDSLRPEAARRSPERLLALTAEAYGAAGVAATGRLPGDAAVVAGDRGGSVVACAFGMGDAFGAGALAEDAGVPLAPAQSAESAFLAPMLLANHNVPQGYLALAASGGWAAPAAAALVGLALVQDGEEFQAALAAPRAVRPGPGAPAYSETGGQPSPALGRVQALWCPGGFDRGQKSCRFGSDPRGFGLARGEGF